MAYDFHGGAAGKFPLVCGQERERSASAAKHQSWAKSAWLQHGTVWREHAPDSFGWVQTKITPTVINLFNRGPFKEAGDICEKESAEKMCIMAAHPEETSTSHKISSSKDQSRLETFSVYKLSCL